MTTELRKTGIEVLKEIPWGTHVCQFFETKQDLLDILVPYFRAGLESGEYCLWVISDPLTQKEATAALRRAVPDLDRHLSERRIEMIPHTRWYLRGGALALQRAFGGWREKLKQALARGHAGMRASGSTAWLKKGWREFAEYERSVDAFMARQRMIILCTYPLAASGAGSILDVARSHHAAIAIRKGRWEIVEAPDLKQAKAEIKRLNEALEQRVAERTGQLAAANKTLKRTIAMQTRAEAERARLFDQVSANREQLRILSRRLLQAQETDRRAFARELHDEIGQGLTGLNLMMTVSPNLPPGKVLSRLLDARSLARDLIKRVRELSMNLRPAMLDELGLVRSLSELFKRYTAQTSIKVQFDHAGLERQRFAPEVESAAYRIVQEALTNVARHAGRPQVTVRLRADARSLSILVADRGKGFDLRRVRSRASTGLGGMQERALLLGGSITIDSAPGKGTRVAAVLPRGGGPESTWKNRRSRKLPRRGGSHQTLEP